MIESLDFLAAFVARVDYPGFTFCVGQKGDGYLLNVEFRDAKRELQRGRKWYISRHATESEIIHTCLLAVLTAEEHEAREHFLFDGKPIFHPHHTLPALESIAECIDARPWPPEVPA